MIATAFIAFIALADTWREAQTIARNLSDRVLAGSAMAIAEKVTLNQTGQLKVEVPFSALEMLASTADDRVFYRVDAAGGIMLTGYAALQPVATGPSGFGFADVIIGTDPVRAATITRALSTGSSLIPFSITVAETTLARNALAKTVLLRSLVRLVGLVATIMIIVWLSVTFAMRPLEKIGVAMEVRAPDDLRPLEMPVPSEALPLVFGMNSFIARLSKALNALRNFTGNASHQLRTPLAVIGTQLAIARRANSPLEIEASLTKAEAAVSRLERVLAQLLLMAKVDSTNDKNARYQADIAMISRDIVAEIIPSALLQNRDLGYEGATQLYATIEPVLFGEILRNLIDNSINHTPAGTIITVSSKQAGQLAVLTVTDNGLGMPPILIEKLQNGFSRKAQTSGAVNANAGTNGHGLGLAIVGEIAERFGAAVTFATRPEFEGTSVAIAFQTKI